VPDVATPQKTAEASLVHDRHSSICMALSLFFLAALWLVLWRLLSGEWFVNEQYF